MGTLQVIHKGALWSCWGHEEEESPAGTASAWQGLLRDHHLRWRRDSLTQHMETKLLREAITFHFPGL